MFHFLKGKLIEKGKNFIVIENTLGGFKIFFPEIDIKRLPKIGKIVKVFCFVFVHHEESSFEIYGFLTEKQRDLFNSLRSVSGIGPKLALKILSLAEVKRILTAVSSGDSEFLSQVSGLSKKGAQRIILELGSKFKSSQKRKDNSYRELKQALLNLGYSKTEISRVLKQIPADLDLKSAIRQALKVLSKR